MKRSLIVFSTIFSLGIGGILGESTPTIAAELSQISSDNSQSYIESKLNVANKNISSLQEEMYQAQKQLENLNNRIGEVQTKINEKNQQISDTKKNIGILQKEVNELTKRMEVRNELLKDRARSHQETGGTMSYLNVLLGSQSFSNFIERAEAIAIIVGTDRKILEEQKTDKEELEKSQSEMKSELLSIETMRNDLKKMKEEMLLKKQEQNNSIKELQEREKIVQDEVFRLKEERALLEKKGEIQSTSPFSSNNNLQVKNGTLNKQDFEKEVGNSIFIWPTIGGTITSYQGPRWGKFHKGIDIARPTDYSILAASSGTVIYAGWINGYGNTIQIKHENGYTTQYAHLASIKVKKGQAVSKGNTIGIMGSTGRSTGIHLDFEVRKNGQLLNPINVLPSR